MGSLVLFTTALPSALHQAGASAAGLGVSLVLIALGIGGVKASIYPFIADQYPHHEPFIRELPSGERVVVDRSLTIQYMYNWYFWCVRKNYISIILGMQAGRLRMDMHSGSLMSPLCPG